jgi:signal transduction histidine kinase
VVVAAGTAVADLTVFRVHLNRWRRRIWVPLGALAVGTLVSLSPWLAPLSRSIDDTLQRLLAPSKPPVGVLMIDFDDASLAAMGSLHGPWPFKRDVHALAIEHLRELGARVIVLNLLMIEPREGDAALARSLSRPDRPVVLAAAGLNLAPAVPVPAQAGGPGEPVLAAVQWGAVVLPAASLWSSAQRPPPIGIVTTPLDNDGVLRRMALWHEASGQRWPTLALAAWLARHGAVATAHAPWPVDEAGRVRLMFTRLAGRTPVMPFERLWRSAVGGPGDVELARAVHGSVVFIGSTALLADRVMTVTGQRDGTDVLAQAYVALRDGSLLRPAPAWAQAMLVLLAGVPAIVAWCSGEAGLRRAVPVALATALGLLLLGAALLWGWHLSLDLAAPLSTLAAGAMLVLVAQQRAMVAAQLRLAQERAIAAAASEAKTAFLANVSHEIRTPLNAVLGVAELLAGTALTDGQRQHVKVFQQAGQTLSDLINDLLDLSKIESGCLAIGNETFTVRAMIERVMALLRARAQAKGLTLTLAVSEDVPDQVEGDRPRIEQALTNLLGNAIKFTAHGRVGLDVTVEHRPDEPAVTLHFAVSDTGIGIAPDKLGLIFEPFAQADGSVTRNFGGTGLGLTITRALAKLMGGQVSARSVQGRGSLFTLSLPLSLPLPSTTAEPAGPVVVDEAVDAAAASIERSAAALSDTTVAVGTQSILLAEDNEVNVYLFEAMLAGVDLRIDLASDGPTALQMACAGRYDLIFMDVQMPGMDGLTVTRALRRHEDLCGRKPTPVVALTANAYAEDLQRSLDAGCNMHIPKPFSRAQLLAAVARFMPGRAAAAD